jgi:hypothetical protein
MTRDHRRLNLRGTLIQEWTAPSKMGWDDPRVLPLLHEAPLPKRWRKPRNGVPFRQALTANAFSMARAEFEFIRPNLRIA